LGITDKDGPNVINDDPRTDLGSAQETYHDKPEDSGKVHNLLNECCGPFEYHEKSVLTDLNDHIGATSD
jgi:hypothetical protein